MREVSSELRQKLILDKVALVTKKNATPEDDFGPSELRHTQPPHPLLPPCGAGD